jgi:hypothetical protein
MQRARKVRRIGRKAAWTVGLALLGAVLLPLPARAWSRILLLPPTPRPVVVVKPAPVVHKKVWVASHRKRLPSGRRVWVAGRWKIR